MVELVIFDRRSWRSICAAVRHPRRAQGEQAGTTRGPGPAPVPRTRRGPARV